VFIGGDAAHLFTPTGGLGYNTAVEDAVNLGWKLSAVLKGQAAPRLLESYDAERRPLAVRNTSYAKGFADSLGIEPPREIEDEGAAGELARRQAGEYLARHGAAEFNIPGITFGGRYDRSPAIFADGSTAPADRPNVYVPTACQGGRPPHLWLGDGRSLFDAFGFEWTLLRLGKDEGAGFEPPHSASALDLTVFDLRTDEARALRRRARAHPPRPGRRLARQRRPHGRQRAAGSPAAEHHHHHHHHHGGGHARAARRCDSDSRSRSRRWADGNGPLAPPSDSGHMLTDGAALALAAFAAWMARRRLWRATPTASAAPKCLPRW
jgi:hypothetical protein